MATKRSSNLRPATPARPNRPLRDMPRQARAQPAPRRERPGRTYLGRDWPLPFSPIALGLVLILAGAVGAAWWFEGRFETTPAEAAKLVIPFKPEQVQTIEMVTPDGRASFSRGADGKMAVEGPAPTPTPPPAAGATPAPVVIAPSTRVESVVGQLATLRIDRVLSTGPESSTEFGLSTPRLTLKVVPKAGEPLTLTVGALNPDETLYYVRREERRDTVLVSRYALDDLIKVAGDVLKPPA